MKYGVCALSIVPCRLETADSSEMVNQLLFGDAYKVIDERAKWVKVRAAFDDYEGWICRKQHTEISEKEYHKLNKAFPVHINFDLVAIAKQQDTEEHSTLVMGSSLPGLEENIFSLSSTLSYEFKGHAVLPPKKGDRSKMVENAYMYLNAPYLWGGKSPFGIDCSGFTQVVYKMSGIKLPRDASQQAEKGVTLSFIEESLPGDLAFFDDAEGNIIHVGILLDNNSIIHASGKVRIDKIDHQGIYNLETKKYSHRLRIIKQLLP